MIERIERRSKIEDRYETHRASCTLLQVYQLRKPADPQLLLSILKDVGITAWVWIQC